MQSRRSYQASHFAPILGWEPCPDLPTTAPPSGRNVMGCFLHQGEPAVPSHRLDAAYLGPINHTKVQSMQPQKYRRLFTSLHLLKHLFHRALGQGSIAVQDNVCKHPFHLKLPRFNMHLLPKTAHLHLKISLKQG